MEPRSEKLSRSGVAAFLRRTVQRFRLPMGEYRRRRDFSEPHLTRDERRIRKEAFWAQVGGALLDRYPAPYPPMRITLPPRALSRTPDLDEAFLRDRRDAGDIIVDDPDGGHIVFPIGTLQAEIDWQMERRAKMRSPRRPEVPPPG